VWFCLSVVDARVGETTGGADRCGMRDARHPAGEECRSRVRL